MEQKIILGAISTICIGLLTNYIYDKLKSHSVRESDLEIKIKLSFIELNFKSKNTKN